MLGLETLRLVKAALGDRVRIISVGAVWNPADFEAEGVVECRGLLPSLEAVADLYRRSHLGLVFMFTPHPSYQPLEYMASGCVTVTNRNPGTAWLLKDRENCLIVDPVPGLAADRIIRALSEPMQLSALREAGLKPAETLSWDKAFTAIEAFILRRSGFTGGDPPPS